MLRWSVQLVNTGAAPSTPPMRIAPEPLVVTFPLKTQFAKTGLLPKLIPRADPSPPVWLPKNLQARKVGRPSSVLSIAPPLVVALFRMKMQFMILGLPPRFSMPPPLLCG